MSGTTDPLCRLATCASKVGIFGLRRTPQATRMWYEINHVTHPIPPACICMQPQVLQGLGQSKLPDSAPKEVGQGACYLMERTLSLETLGQVMD